jgi:hypothetical protein
LLETKKRWASLPTPYMNNLNALTNIINYMKRDIRIPAIELSLKSERMEAKLNK